MDLQVDVLLINVGCEEPSLLVLVSHVLVHGNVEDKSGTNDVNYIVVSQEQVMDGIASLMARCIMLNPKAKENLGQQQKLMPIDCTSQVQNGLQVQLKAMIDTLYVIRICYV